MATLPSLQGPDALLPVARALIDEVADAAVADPSAGVSCRAGCSTCCSQPVPVTASEVRALHDAVAALPDDRRAAVEARIAEVAEVVGGAGIEADDLCRVEADGPALLDLTLRYVALDAPCPLLGPEGTCTVRPARPLACREYLVTSDPVHCAGERPEAVVRIRTGAGVRAGWRRTSSAMGEPGMQILSLALAAARPSEPPASGPWPGPALVRGLRDGYGPRPPAAAPALA